MENKKDYILQLIEKGYSEEHIEILADAKFPTPTLDIEPAAPTTITPQEAFDETWDAIKKVKEVIDSGTHFGIGQEFDVKPETALATKCLAKVGTWFEKRYTQGQASVYGETVGTGTLGEIKSHTHTQAPHTHSMVANQNQDVGINRKYMGNKYNDYSTDAEAPTHFEVSTSTPIINAFGGTGNKAEGQFVIKLTCLVKITNAMWEELNS